MNTSAFDGEDDHLFNLDEDEHDAFDDKRVSVTFAPNKSKQVHRLSYFNSASKYCKSDYQLEDGDFQNLDLKKLMTVSQSIRKHKRWKYAKKNKNFALH